MDALCGNPEERGRRRYREYGCQVPFSSDHTIRDYERLCGT
jgi:hypothetical protein